MTEKGSLSYVKNVIHSLVVSSPVRMTVERLKGDYAREEGTPMPFAMFGFRDIESFLNSIDDTVLLQGYGPMAKVCAKWNAKTAHIQNLVHGQKKPSNRSKGRGPLGHTSEGNCDRSGIRNEPYKTSYHQQSNEQQLNKLEQIIESLRANQKQQHKEISNLRNEVTQLKQNLKLQKVQKNVMENLFQCRC